MAHGELPRWVSERLPDLSDLEAIYRLGFADGAEHEAELRGGSQALTGWEAGGESWRREVLRIARSPPPEPEG